MVSPGIDTYGPYVAAFAANAGEVIGEVELASRFYQGKIIGITGTNGKTTTTELVARILAHAGLGGTPCGNYGTPFRRSGAACRIRPRPSRSNSARSNLKPSARCGPTSRYG